FPTRLLELIADEVDPKLVITAGCFIPDRQPYATLSHCWGKIPIVRLLESNIGAFRQRVPFDQLPKTFRDAISVAKAFGIRYLWIDSLCIIQDSAEDWTRESVRMGDVYRGGCINLSAAGANDGSEGCFFERTSEVVVPPIYKLSGNVDVGCTSSESLCCLIDADYWHRNCTLSPLFCRAWIFQERMLARRILHFGREQLFWECRQENCSEAFPEGLPISLQESSFFLSKYIYEQFLSGTFSTASQSGRFLRQWKQEPLPEERLELFWEILVADYSRCELSFGKDKLIALSGVAEDVYRLQREHCGAERSDYLAGLWRAHLPRSLLWKSHFPQDRPHDYRAPTWSWASVDGPISWDDARWDDCLQYESRIESASVETKQDKYYFGQISSGYIVISGPIWELDWIFSPDGKHMVVPSPEEVIPRWLFHIDGIARDMSCVSVPMSNDFGALTVHLDVLYERPSQIPRDCFGLLILRYGMGSSGGPCMLLLVRVKHARRTFRRIGLIMWSERARAKCWANWKDFEQGAVII
ncbi:heterokaryon incompatibility protein-domain-containing protein, partial [Lophiotrema nucula]